ncbi:MAG: hypothetical protein WBS24_18810 [Terriglobales bacterium]
MNRTIVVVLGLMIIGFGIASLQHVGLMYHNWWKEAVFGPFAIVIGIVFIALMFKLGSLERDMKKHTHGSAKRNRHRS